MRIEIARPPNYDQINAAFNIEGKHVIIAYGDTIFNPMNGKVTRTLIEHEMTHCEQQGGGQDEELVKNWWNEYIADPHFRFLQELPAHRAEFNHYAKRHTGKRAVEYLDHCAEKFSSGIYGNIVTKADARHSILTGYMPAPLALKAAA